jgi:hypothetical protein
MVRRKQGFLCNKSGATRNARVDRTCRLCPSTVTSGFPTQPLTLVGFQVTLRSLDYLIPAGCSTQVTFLFHVYIATQHPEVVKSLRFFNSDDPFEPIKLKRAVLDHTDYDASHHGLLTTVIRYKTPYTTTDGNQVSVSIALGMDVSTNTIFGVPTLTAFEFIIDLKKLSAFSPIMKETFQLTRSAGSLGLPAGIQLDLEDLRCQYEAAQIGLIVGDPKNSME